MQHYANTAVLMTDICVIVNDFFCVIVKGEKNTEITCYISKYFEYCCVDDLASIFH